MKAVILSGSPGTDLFPFANAHPKLLLPLATRPVLSYTVETLGQCGISDIIVVGSADQQCDREAIEGLSDSSGPTKVSYFEEAVPLGTAGALQGLRAALGASDFLVLSTEVLPEREELEAILSFHSSNGPVTMALEPVEPPRELLENVEVSDDGTVLRTHTRHASHDQRRPLAACGVYVFSQKVLDAIPLSGHMDIKEQLIPKLGSAGIRVAACRMRSPMRRIATLRDYVALDRERVAGGDSPEDEAGQSIRIGENVELAPTARLIGPLVIADGCVIGEDAELIGPASIGSGAVVGERAFVRESILFANARVGRAAFVRSSLVAEGSHVRPGTSVSHAIVVDGETHACESLSDHDALRDQLPDHFETPATTSPLRRAQRLGYFAAKRALDVFVASVAIVFLLPLLPFVALAIRLNSPGPALFRQQRCGLGGREFTMYKLRTMVEGAEDEQRALAAHKHVDGPMFKMRDDPRITKVGGMLRKAGIDELPQLFNVLRGDMSLVGPRPLAMEEMKFAPSWRDIRLSVRPGLTGLWQISERGNVAFHSWITSDIEYVRRQSFRLDLELILRTILFSLRGSGS